MKHLIALLTILIIAPSLQAQEIEADDIIKYRKSVMTAIKGHNNAIKSIVTGKVPFKDKLSGHVSAMQDLFAEIDQVFPEGSDFGKTEAKDAIWDNPQKFEQTVKDSLKALNDFQAVVSGGDMKATAAAFKKFGKGSCGSCHKSFRKKKKN